MIWEQERIEKPWVERMNKTHSGRELEMVKMTTSKKKMMIERKVGGREVRNLMWEESKSVA
jgi:hypothetical protein